MVGKEVVLLARDGQIWDFSPDDAANYRKTAASFAPYSVREMQERLEAEFGRQMEVTATGHYLVVHPVGKAEVWAERFEQMYREFVHNFGVRGISTQQPELPLVAIVFTRQEDFLRYAIHDGVRCRHGPAAWLLFAENEPRGLVRYRRREERRRPTGGKTPRR